MQKTLLYLFIFLLFGGGVYYFLFNKKESPFPESEAGFQIKDTASIGTVFLTDHLGNNILLNRTGSGWILNKKYKALPLTVNTLLSTLYEQIPLYPTPKAAHNGVVAQMAGRGIKVEVYDRSGEKMRVFYVGSEVHDMEGTSMLMEGAKRSYVVRLGQYIGLLNSRYSTDFANWRDRTIISLDSNDIQSVSVTYPDAPLNSFTINDDNGKLSMVVDPGVIGTHKMNERRVKSFLGFFTYLTCEGYLNGMTGLDTLLTTAPKKCAIDITSKKGVKQHLDVYWMPMTERSKNTDTIRNKQVPRGYDIDRYYAVGNNFQDTMLIQEFTFGKVFRKAYEFYQEDPTIDVVNGGSK